MKNLQPEIVWGYFHEITQIPRPSKKEEKIRQYLRDFAAKHKLALREDKIGNIVITRPAAKGMESHPAIILQSHVDMVCEKEADLDFDFETQPIQTYIDGDWVRARGTTLGADCGIGMALAMAALTSAELRAPAIEALFTVDEEQGLTGAMNLGEGMLTGAEMINLDSEDEGEIYIGCAGGVDTIARFDADFTEIVSPEKYDFYRLTVGGLRGGHSGDDINRGLACANKVLNRQLWAIMSRNEVLLCSIDGGNLRNAIARDAHAVLAIAKECVEKVITESAQLTLDIKNEFAITEPDMHISLEVTAPESRAMGSNSAHRLVAVLQAAPHGVQAMSQTMPGMVETSTNLASVKIKGSEIVVTTSQRSSIESAKRDIALTVESVFHMGGGIVNHTDGYPGWAPNPSSPLVKRSAEIYRKMFGKEPAIKAIHAGLECGLFLTKYPHLDIISIGPTLRGVHSPAERIEIKAVDMVWRYLFKLLSK